MKLRTEAGLGREYLVYDVPDQCGTITAALRGGICGKGLDFVHILDPLPEQFVPNLMSLHYKFSESLHTSRNVGTTFLTR